MQYTLEDCSYYTQRKIGTKTVYIFDDHNMALPVWGTFAALFGPLHLISFDTHTDTHPAFSKLMCSNGGHSDHDYKRMLQKPIVKEQLAGLNYRQGDFDFEDVFRYSFEIFNTEQILTGVVFGYLSSYAVRCHRTKDALISSYEQYDRGYGYDATYIGDDDDRKPVVRSPLILDIDLDYFREAEEINQGVQDYLAPYLRNAVAVTIAREHRFFNAERFDDYFTVEDAEARLLDLLKDTID